MRCLQAWERIAGVLAIADVGNSTVFMVGPNGLGQASVGEYPKRLVVLMGADVPGTLVVWQGMQLADMPAAGAPTSTLLHETTFPYVAGVSMTRFVVEDLIGPFVQLRYTNGATATTFFRLYAMLQFG